MNCCSASGWLLPGATGAAHGSRPPSAKAPPSLTGTPLLRPTVDASGTSQEGSSDELSSPSLSGDRGRQCSGISSSVSGSENGPAISGFCSKTGPLSPGKQMTAKYQ